MKEEFVPYELAVKLKQLGFDEPCWGYYDVNEGYSIGYAFCYSDKESQPEIGCSAPTLSQAFRWFRENHGVMHRITSYAFGYEMHIDNTPSINIKYVDRRYDTGIDYKTYEEAELACLEKLIEIVETEQQEI